MGHVFLSYPPKCRRHRRKKKLPQACTLVGVPHEAGEVSGSSPHLHEGENNVSETGGVTDKQTSPTLQIYHFQKKKKRDSLEIFFRESLLFERRTNLGQFPAPKTTVTTALRDKTPLGASVAVIASEATAKASFALRYTGWVAVVPSVMDSGAPRIIW